jgi:RHS repeat-associated protein
MISDRLSVRLLMGDGQGSSYGIQGRQAHLPFGEDLNTSGTTDKHRFTSYERDTESGLDYAVNRGFSPVLGRFQSSDPYKPGTGLIDPQSWNRFSYAANDPINRIDRLGLFREELVNFFGQILYYAYRVFLISLNTSRTWTHHRATCRTMQGCRRENGMSWLNSEWTKHTGTACLMITG